MKVQISARAQRAIECEVGRYPETETGGLLLGYSEAKARISVIEATDGGYQDTTHKPDSFVYDDEYERHLCGILSGLYDPPLQLIGLWHKHNCSGGKIPFSHADEKMHRQLLQLCPYPCLSILLEKSSPEIYEWRTFLLLTNGECTELEDTCIACGEFLQEELL